jgi:hypothetical protein
MGYGYGSRFGTRAVVRGIALAGELRKTGNGLWPLACAVTLLIWLLARISAGMAQIDPDAAYGLVIARQLAETGMTSFDAQTMTSGFSPLWVGLLALQRQLLGPDLAITFALEAVLLAGALFFLLRAAPVRSRLFQAAFTAAFAWIAAGLGLMGLEASLLAFCLSLFVAAVAWRTESLLGGLALGAAALLCIATRLETAFFVFPALILAPTRMSNRVSSLFLLLLGCLGYAAADLIKFGAALPISSHMRSLGGLQINASLVAQGLEAWARDGAAARLLIVGAALALAPLLVPLTPRDGAARTLTIAAAIGGWLFLLRLLFFSSWRIGPAHELAVLFPLLAAYFAIAPAMAQALDGLHERLGRPRLMQPAPAALAATVLAGLIGQSAMAATESFPAPLPAATDTKALIAALLREQADILAGQRIAMGDNAGLMALHYDGPVTALEGQAGDLEYLRALQAGGDITPLLCERGVRFVAAFHPEADDASRMHLPVLNPYKTAFAGPTVDIYSRDAVGVVRRNGATLRIWRLGACWRNGYAANEQASQLR